MQKEIIPDNEDGYDLNEYYKKALRICGELLSRRDYSERKLREKLTASGIPGEAVDMAIAEMIKARYLDDRRYTDSFVRAHLKDRSLARIKRDLYDLGISEEIVSDVLQERDDETLESGELFQIRKYLEKKGCSSGPVSYEESMKLMAALYRRGFRPELIRKALSDYTDC